MPSIRGPLRCPICDIESPNIRGFSDRDASEIECQHCGKFIIAGDLYTIEMDRNPLTGKKPGLTVEDERLLPYLSAYIRQRNNQGTVPVLDRSNWRDFAHAHNKTPVLQKLSKLLELVAAGASYPGDIVEINPELDYPLVDAWSHEELHSLLARLVDCGYLDCQIRHDGTACSVTVKGQEFLEQSTAAPKDIPGTAPAIQNREFSFIKDTELRRVLERDYIEIQRAFNAQCWKSVIILSGGAIEAILMDLLLQNTSAAQVAAKAPRGRSDISRWDLADLINVSVELKFVTNGVEKLSHPIRDYRNLVHPGNEIRNKLTFGAEEAKIALEVLHIVHRDCS